MVGYGTIDCIIGGQVLSAVSGGGMSIAVGVVLVAVLECLIAGFGLKIFHYYERCADFSSDPVPKLLIETTVMPGSLKS
jgi:purine-cytosine permease-like protein